MRKKIEEEGGWWMIVAGTKTRESFSTTKRYGSVCKVLF